MRLANGGSLLDIRETTTLEQQVRLLIQVAAGLDAAHRKGLVHRDVKPSNILVERTMDGDLKAWVTDFGIAAALQPDGPGEEGLQGTAQYLAPERLIRPQDVADRRLDVFSLGVTIYRLFTGELPFDDEILLEVLRKIRQEDPLPPRALAPGLPADLEAIVLKCLAKDPEERYPSAKAVAADLERYLSGETVEAHAASPVYRLSRFIVRHKTLLKLAAVASFLLMIALAVAGFLGLQARAANAEADQRRGQAEDLIGFMLIDLREKLERLGRLDILDDVGERAMLYFDSVQQDQMSGQELARNATALYQIGEVRLGQGKLAEARVPFEQSLDLARRLVERNPDQGERLFDLGQSHFWVGYVLRLQGEIQPAEIHFQEYLSISERLVELAPERSEWRMELAYAYSNLGTLLRDRGDLQGARQRYEHSLQIKQNLAKETPADASHRLALAHAHNALGVILDFLGEAQAEVHFRAELTIKETMAGEDPGNVLLRDHLGVSHNYLGRWLLYHGQWPEAQRHLAEAVALYENLVTHDAENADWKFKLALNQAALGSVLVGLEDTGAGLATLARSCTLLEALGRHDPSSRSWRLALISCHLRSGQVLYRAGRLRLTQQRVRKAVSLLTTAEAENPADPELTRLRAFGNLLSGDLQQAAGKGELARASWKRVIDALAAPSVKGEDGRNLEPWCAALLRLGDTEKAEDGLALLHARGACSPFFPRLCSPDSRPTTPR
jgi:serine/threonine-protein kinase